MLKVCRTKMLVTCLCIIVGLTSVFLYGADLRIRVVVENATLRMKPDMRGDIIEAEIPLGTEYAVKNKVGQWYEIQYISRLGITVTCYIHEMFVEVIKDTPKPKPVVVEPEQEAKQEPPQEAVQSASKKTYPKFDMAFMVGSISGQSFMNNKTSYNSQWSMDLLESVTEAGTINHNLSLKSSLSFGASMAYYFIKGLGLQLRADFISTSIIEDGQQSTYKIDWTWIDGGGSYFRENTWIVTGEQSLTPISFNLTYKFWNRSIIIPYLSGGLTYFTGNSSATTNMGYGFSFWTEETDKGKPVDWQWIDYLSLPVTVDASLNGIGFNIGGGVDLRFHKNVALTIDGVYFAKSEINADWHVKSGTYSGNNFPDYSWIVHQELAEEIAGKLSPVTINPSFFKIQGGIRLIF